jgi:DNA-binding beta-propeller fold protein YncE
MSGMVTRARSVQFANDVKRLLPLLLLAACQYNEAREPHSAIADRAKRNEIRAPPAVQTISNGLAGPESVLYDAQQDAYFISNINGGLLDRDGNGFITRVDAQTLSVDLQWISGLDGPKGMAIAGNSLYVSDVTGVRKFDRRTGDPQGIIALPGATTINDLTSDGRKVWVSDTAIVPASGETFGGTGTDAVWLIENDRATRIASGRDLKQPNGLAYAGGKLWVVTFGGAELYQLDGSSKSNVTELPRGQLDGLVALPDGTFFVTSWDGMAVYRGKGGTKFEPILQSIPNPADIGYDTKRHLLLLPASSQNRVTLHPVK